MESFPTGAGPAQRPERPRRPGLPESEQVAGLGGTTFDGIEPAGLGGTGLAQSVSVGPEVAASPGPGDAGGDEGATPGPAAGSPTDVRGGSSASRTTPRRTPADGGGSARPSPFGRRLDRWDAAIAGLLAVFAMVVVFVFRSALVPTDPWHYVQGAIAFPDGTWRPEGLSRWGYLLPLVPFARLWGDSTATYYILPLLSTGLLAAVLYLLGARHVNRLAGALGSVLALATPLVFVNLSRGYTDLAATMLCGVALLLAVLARDVAEERGPQQWGRAVPGLLLACGFVLGWSVEVRETAVFTWPVVAWVLWRVGPLREVARWIVAPIVGWLLLDMLLQQLIFGDPLLKVRWVLGADISQSEVTSDAVYVGHSRWWYGTVLVRSMWELTGGPALVLCLLIGIVGGFAFRRHLGLIWAWGMLALVPLWLQGGVLDPEHPSVRLDVARYWLSFIAPLMLAAAGTMVIVVSRSREWGRWVSGGLAALLALGLLVPSGMSMASYPGFAPNGGDAMSQLRAELTRTGISPEARIWADWGTQRVLPAYQNGPFGETQWSAASFRSLNRLLAPELTDGKGPQPGDYVVLYSDTDRTCWHCRRALRPVEAAFGPFPAAGWELLFTSTTGNLRLFRMGPDVVWPKAHSQDRGEAESEEADESEPGP